jgi:hypothetical protein
MRPYGPENGRSPRDFSDRKRAFGMKQMNVFPMVMMLIVVVVLIAWLGGYFS